jgi:hypothetical protein
MTSYSIKIITAQAAGAFGEKAVEAELLRRNWIPANVNATVKNAAKFDIYALKGNRSVQIQVKTCQAGHGGIFVLRLYASQTDNNKDSRGDRFHNRRSHG